MGLEFGNEREIDLKNIGNFVGYNLPGKINNKYNAKDKYIKKIKKDEDYLENVKSTDKNFLRLRNIFRKTKYVVFGVLFPSEEKPNKKTDDIDMPPLETEEEAEQIKEQKARGLKIMTPNQLLTRLSILLAQKKAGNNSQQLNNEIRQIIYSLYSYKWIQYFITLKMLKPMNHIDLDCILLIN